MFDPSQNKSNWLLQWWPIILFSIIQIFSAGLVMERIITVETRITNMLPRNEWILMNIQRDKQFDVLQLQVDRLDQRGQTMERLHLTNKTSP